MVAPCAARAEAAARAAKKTGGDARHAVRKARTAERVPYIEERVEAMAEAMAEDEAATAAGASPTNAVSLAAHTCAVPRSIRYAGSVAQTVLGSATKTGVAVASAPCAKAAQPAPEGVGRWGTGVTAKYMAQIAHTEKT